MNKKLLQRKKNPQRENDVLRAYDRIPPHNLDAEQGLLASCILEGGGSILTDCISRKMSSDYFFSGAHQLIFQALLDLNLKNIGIDEITLCEHLRSTDALEIIGGPAYINELTNRVEVTTHSGHWMSIIREKHFLRKLISTAARTVETAFNPTGDLDHLLDSVERDFLEISADRVTDNTQHAMSGMSDAKEMMRHMINSRGEITGVPTGFSDLDKLTYGFQPGHMIVVAARPGMGKTSIALNFIEGALFPKRGEPIPTMMFSLEMPTKELSMRMICARGRIDVKKLRDGFIEKEKAVEIDAIADEFSRVPLFFDDSGGQTILEIRAKARRMHKQHKLGLIVIDYLQLINGTDNTVVREQQIAEASRHIKSLAKELKLPIIALAQLNRKSEDENRAPKISDLRESGSIEQDADIVMLIDKKRGGSRDDEDESSGYVVPRKLEIAKNRGGPTGHIDLMFHSAFTKFTLAEKNF